MDGGKVGNNCRHEAVTSGEAAVCKNCRDSLGVQSFASTIKPTIIPAPSVVFCIRISSRCSAV